MGSSYTTARFSKMQANRFLVLVSMVVVILYLNLAAASPQRQTFIRPKPTPTRTFLKPKTTIIGTTIINDRHRGKRATDVDSIPLLPLHVVPVIDQLNQS